MGDVWGVSYSVSYRVLADREHGRQRSGKASCDVESSPSSLATCCPLHVPIGSVSAGTGKQTVKKGCLRVNKLGGVQPLALTLFCPCSCWC
jgi:hypothetical protein